MSEPYMEMFANILKIYLSLRYTSPSFIHFDPIGKHGDLSKLLLIKHSGDQDVRSCSLSMPVTFGNGCLLNFSLHMFPRYFLSQSFTYLIQWLSPAVLRTPWNKSISNWHCSGVVVLSSWQSLSEKNNLIWRTTENKDI